MIQGQLFDRYEVWGRLSGGGMSEVYLGKHVALSAPVVVKTIAPVLADREDVVAGVHRSARLVARVASPHVVRVLDVGDAELRDGGRTPCVVEEYVDGLDLAELAAARREALRRPLPLWAVAEWTAQAAQGLHAAHQAGVIHRDVKPANLFLEGESRVKVGDFGVAVEAAAAEGSRAAGTVDYMAPEQLLGEGVDRRADLWSLGATAFALRYGLAPFASSSDAARPEVPPRFPPATSPDEAYFQHVLERLLARRPEARPRTAGTTAAVLRQLARTIHPRLPTRRQGRYLQAGGCRLAFEVGDIAAVPCDAVVNSAYAEMRMDDGVGAALVRAGGAAIEEEARAGGERALGACVPTTAGSLPCRAVLHAVSAWRRVSCVGRAMHRALAIAEREGYRRLAVPALGTGRGGITVEASAHAIASALRLHLQLGTVHLDEVRFVFADEPTRDVFAEVVSAVFLSAYDAIRSSDGEERDELGDGRHGLPMSHEDFHAPTRQGDGAEPSDALPRERTRPERLPPSEDFEEGG